METTQMHITQNSFEKILEREARLFAARSSGDGQSDRPIRLIIADFEYRWDRLRYDAYRVEEGCDAEPLIRWPFHRIAAASWLQLRIDPGEDIPVIEDVVVVTENEATESEMAERFFNALCQAGDACLVTWGGETKDLAVLRRCANEFGLLLPPQLIDGSPHARERVDLCRAVTVQAKSPHLPEYAAATSIPAKPSPSKKIGTLVEAGAWEKVREQVLADVMTTSVIALRHFCSHGIVEIDRACANVAIGKAVEAAIPESAFAVKVFRPWARDAERASRLRGKVYRPD
ncbi:hypothetical protein [Qipengyuania flava]|uniref:hypothetical protein n=1 Tax=Qipengyuania flava TaxID=192812 RepID=UPI003BB039B3